MAYYQGPICSSLSTFGQSCSDPSGLYFQSDGAKIRLSTLHTPTSSSEACNQGEWFADANYIYICTATNTIKRVALSSF